MTRKEIEEQRKKVRGGLQQSVLNFIEEVETKLGRELKITSGKRTASQGVGKNANNSKHNFGEAIDISAEEVEVFNFLYNTQDGLEIMNRYGLGIIDETDPKVMKDTGAEGKHFHIGTDPFYKKQLTKRLDTLKSNGAIDQVYSFEEILKKPELKNSKTQVHYVGDGHNHSHEEINMLSANELIGGLGMTSEELARETNDLIDTMKTDDELDKENPDRALLKEIDSKYKEEQLKMEAVMNMYDSLAQTTVDTNYQDVGGVGYVDTPVQKLNTQQTNNIFIGGYE